MNNVIWAKPYQSYEEHINASYKAWKQTTEAKRNLIRRFSQEFRFDERRFLISSLLSVVLHDVGKCTDIFQQMMVAKQKGVILTIVKTTGMNLYLSYMLLMEVLF